MRGLKFATQRRENPSELHIDFPGFLTPAGHEEDILDPKSELQFGFALIAIKAVSQLFNIFVPLFPQSQKVIGTAQ